MQKLSLVLITRNAAGQLAACLDSARGLADEIVLLDSGSDDGTLALAERYGARIASQPFLGFGPQKRAAVALAQYDWVLCLDADERLTPELAASIRAALADPQHAAYRFARRNRFFGRYLGHGEAYPDWCLRLFDRRRAGWSADAVHEKVEVREGGTGSLAGDLLHDSAESLASYLTKQNRYTDLQAEALFAAGRRAGIGKMALSPLTRFIRFYFVRRGFLDGAGGFAHILIGSFFAFVKYAKLAERWQRHDSERT
ncbi:glycosyltransferase family 2 protein [Chitinimonas koreensis]|uniref:glycosyltransferase family 2 protein n=1 Tax=Chitinimonas koreensis TaxID=356302 RepID=UPI00041AC636|nr:glycosyltransferase family 2 protein [Chitinimonas koreensis]QNM96907.1 glycosyltransferase family 2 protein [Chitinimonas koreensis]